MATYVYEIATGRLESQGSEDMRVASEEVLAERGLAVVRRLPSLDQLHRWDETSRTVVDVDPMTLKRVVTSAQFILSFTPQEFAAIRASQDPLVGQFLLAAQVSSEIDTHGTTTMQALDYLVSIGLLTAERAATIKG